MDDFQSMQMDNSRLPRRTYLITYSQADLLNFSSRKQFGKCIKTHFNKGSGKVNMQHWACSLEKHQNGGNHYHVALKLTGPKRWKSVKESITSSEGIMVNFSDQHDNYHSAYRYICKEDTSVHHSKHHPNLENISSPRTKKSTKACRDSRKAKSSDTSTTSEPSPKKPSNSKSKPKRLSRLEVSKLMAKNNIHRATELHAAAEERRKEGQADLAAFVLSCTKKSLNDLIENTWEMQNAKATAEREKRSRMQVLEKARLSSCVDGCDMEWYICSHDILQKNSINPYLYADAIGDLLIHGCGKFRNVMITDPANYGKTFMLKPLEIIYHAFCNPANDKYAWVGADNAEEIILQDFRWSSELICWKGLLLLLESEPVKLPSPKTQFATDVCIKTDIPIFATSKAKIEFVGKHNTRDNQETGMMDVRWKILEFHHRIPQYEQKTIIPCPRCFTELVFLENSE